MIKIAYNNYYICMKYLKIKIEQQLVFWNSQRKMLKDLLFFKWILFVRCSFIVSTYKEFTESYFYIFFESAYPSRSMSQLEQSQPYAPQVCLSGDEQECQQIYKRRVEKNYEKNIEGKWTQEQNLKYILFMDYHSKIFISKQKRKSQRIFKSLSDFLTTRTPRQCRSHFQKIMNKFKKLKKVKQYYQQQVGLEKYQQELEKLSRDIQPPVVKSEQTTETKIVSTVSIQVQTDPLKVQISDLSNGQILKLMALLNQYQKTQLPFWMTQQPLPPRFSL